MNPIISPEAREAAHLEVSTVLVRTFDGQGNPSDGVHIGHYVQSLLDSKQAEIDEANKFISGLLKTMRIVAEWLERSKLTDPDNMVSRNMDLAKELRLTMHEVKQCE